jgi:hypothetical protein
MSDESEENLSPYKRLVKEFNSADTFKKLSELLILLVAFFALLEFQEVSGGCRTEGFIKSMTSCKIHAYPPDLDFVDCATMRATCLSYLDQVKVRKEGGMLETDPFHAYAAFCECAVVRADNELAEIGVENPATCEFTSLQFSAIIMSFVALLLTLAAASKYTVTLFYILFSVSILVATTLYPCYSSEWWAVSNRFIGIVLSGVYTALFLLAFGAFLNNVHRLVPKWLRRSSKANEKSSLDA